MTIKEIAKMAGVSSAAVSRYLNGGSLSQEKRESIRTVIRQTSYRPTAAAQSLRSKITDYVGVIVPKISSDAVSRVTAGITQVLSRQGYLCLLANTDNDPEQELTYLDLFESRSVAGIILMATVLSPRHQDAIRACSAPLVIAGQQCEGVPCVYHDDFNAAREITECLLRGHSHPPEWLYGRGGAGRHGVSAGRASGSGRNHVRHRLHCHRSHGGFAGSRPPPAPGGKCGRGG